MTLIPFLPRLEAQEILERYYESEAQVGEIEAELGSSYFHCGMASWDATAQARAHMNQTRNEFERTPEGQRFMAEVEAAKFMQDASHGLSVVTVEEINDPRIFTPVGAQLIPEFWPDVIVKGDFAPAPSEDNPPF